MIGDVLTHYGMVMPYGDINQDHIDSCNDLVHQIIKIRYGLYENISCQSNYPL